MSLFGALTWFNVSQMNKRDKKRAKREKKALKAQRKARGW